MKKDLKSKSKRKWIVSGTLILGGVTLLTTGFATWIVGVNKTNQDNNTNVTVEGTVNESIELQVKLTDADIKVSEKHTKGPNEIFGTDESAPETDFKISAEFKIIVGNSYLEKNKLTSVSFALNEAPKGVENLGTNKVTTTQEFNKRVAGEYTYLDINTPSIAIEEGTWNVAEDGSSKVYTYTATDLEIFKWGTLFTNKAPSQFYNSSELTGTKEELEFIVNEMNKMQEDLNNKTLVVTATVNTEAQAA